MDQIVCDHLKLDVPCSRYDRMVSHGGQGHEPQKQVKISLVGKYVELQDAYISVVEALKHSGYANDAEIKINWVNANDVTAENVAELLSDADGNHRTRWFWSTWYRRENSSHPYARER